MEELDPEYREVNSYLRHYSSLRFVMVSVYFAVSAAVITVAFGLVGPADRIPPWLPPIFRVMGLGVTVVFGLYEFRLERLIRYYQGRARELEKVLPYKTMQKRPKSKLTFGATWILYAMFAAFWLGFLIMSGRV
jgi:hypothetical protein